MARRSKAKYTSKQQRQARHIEEGYEKRGVGEDEAGARAWATVNKTTGGRREGGLGRKVTRRVPARKAARTGRRVLARRSASARSTSAKKVAKTRARKSSPRKSTRKRSTRGRSS
jgi:hypothetical protein